MRTPRHVLRRGEPTYAIARRPMRTPLGRPMAIGSISLLPAAASMRSGEYRRTAAPHHGGSPGMAGISPANRQTGSGCTTRNCGSQTGFWRMALPARGSRQPETAIAQNVPFAGRRHVGAGRPRAVLLSISRRSLVSVSGSESRGFKNGPQAGPPGGEYPSWQRTVPFAGRALAFAFAERPRSDRHRNRRVRETRAITSTITAFALPRKVRPSMLFSTCQQ